MCVFINKKARQSRLLTKALVQPIQENVTARYAIAQHKHHAFALVFKNLPDSRQNKMRCYVMVYVRYVASATQIFLFQVQR